MKNYPCTLSMPGDANLDLQLDQLHSGATIARKLGEGASAIVYDIKLKEGIHGFLKYYFKSDSDSLMYFKNESALLTKLSQHTLISSYVPRILASNNSMLLMSPVGQDLGINRFNSKYFAQLVDVFRNIHRDLGIIHRDVQPDNILLNNETDTIFIIDWACSTEIKDTAVPYDGTIFYAAQELIPFVFTDLKYSPKPAHDLESIIKLLYHVVNQEKVDQCEVDVCQLNDVVAWWNEALKDEPWPSYLKAARQEDDDSILKIIEQCLSTK